MSFPISSCPRCGGTKILRKEKYKGVGYAFETLSTEPRQAERDMAGSEDYFSDAEFTYISKWWSCAKCNKRLFTNEEYAEYTSN